MKRSESLAKRMEAAEAVASGMTAAEVAQVLGVSRELVYRSCHEFGVKVTNGRTHDGDYLPFRILAMVLNTDKTYKEIAETLNIPMGTVNATVHYAHQAGIVFWDRERNFVTNKPLVKNPLKQAKAQHTEDDKSLIVPEVKPAGDDEPWLQEDQ